ncbi:hypothetical protein [Nonomuraea endophytica]|uniref:Uncharacterized protein n=1 Tax=Nonomuraea endophytica TaxID=714136 RepID=A0A7W8EKV3_9ACTN|nr:hypothetical protein [Nonomuraea endophytica]MBB5082991.1 hypothetical protein [Nonomuraea endophytica]
MSPAPRIGRREGIDGLRALADLLDYCPDTWMPSELVATVLLLTAVTLHLVAEVLQNCSAEGK